MEAYKSTAPDSGTEERNARHFFTRLLNRVSGSAEYSGGVNITNHCRQHLVTINVSTAGPQAASTFMGRKAEYKLHDTKYLYADSAIDFVLKMLDQINDPNYKPSLGCHSSKSSLSGYSSFDSAVYSDDELSSSASSSSAESKSSEDRRLPEIRDRCDDGYDLTDFKNLTEEEEFGPDSLNQEDAALVLDGFDDDDLDPLGPRYRTHGDERQKDDRFSKLQKRLAVRSGSVPVITDKFGNPAVVLQAHDFYYKPDDFAIYSLFEFVCSVRRNKVKQSDKLENDQSECDSDASEPEIGSDSENERSQPVKASKPRGRGRPALKGYAFHEDHPLYGLYNLECLSVHTNAIIVARTPPCPGPRPNPLTDAWKQLARNFAVHMLVVYRPWDGPNDLPRTITWRGYCDWIVELKSSESLIDRTRLAFVTLASNNLRFNATSAKILRFYRALLATRWATMAPEARPRACFFGDGKEKDPNLPSDATRRQMELAAKDLMRRTLIRSTNDKKRDAMTEATMATINTLFPSDPGAPKGPKARADLFAPPVHSLLNCFSVELAQRVHAQNKASDQVKKPVESSGKKKRKPAHHDIPEPQASKLPDDIQWSTAQKALIDEVEQYLIKIQAWRSGGGSRDNLPPAPVLVVLGAPGVGKTTVLSRIVDMCAEYDFPLICAAMTGQALDRLLLHFRVVFTQCCSGVAAGTLLHGLTVHTAFDIKVIDDDHRGKNQYQEILKSEQVYYLRQVLELFQMHNNNDYIAKIDILFMTAQFHNIDTQLNEGVPVGVFLDEFSMIPADMLGQV